MRITSSLEQHIPTDSAAVMIVQQENRPKGPSDTEVGISSDQYYESFNDHDDECTELEQSSFVIEELFHAHPSELHELLDPHDGQS